MLLHSLITLMVAVVPAEKAQAPAAPSPATAGAAPVVVLETSLGSIKLALHADKTPKTVQNFLEYVRAGHYAGTIFHRVIPNFMVQGGGLDADLKEKPQRAPVQNEAKSAARNRRGTIAMARTSNPHSATAQFFINVKDNAMLDFGVSPDGWGYTVFGEVVEGMDVVDRIVAVPTMIRGPHEAVPRVPVVIKAARVVTP